MTVHKTFATLHEADPQGEDAKRLLQEMRAEAFLRYGDAIDASAEPPKNDPLVARSTFIIARIDGEAIGCAALRPADLQTAEVRRMYVASKVRRRGIGRLLLEELEHIAVGFGFRFLRLETGNRQPEAIALYEACGFQVIPAYGCYIDDPLSVCFEKRLTK